MTPTPQDLNDALQAAIDFALEVHATHSYGKDSYDAHLREVEGVLLEYGYDDLLARQGAWLHDSIEDGGDPDAIGDRLRELGGEALLEVVLFCSDSAGPSRKARKRLTCARMRSVIEDQALPEDLLFTAIRVKTADRLANMRRSVKDDPDLLPVYRDEGPAFREALHVPGVCPGMWAEFDELMKAEGNE